MKTVPLLILFLILKISTIEGQTFINGSFENNTVDSCLYNQADSIFNTKISNVYAFGKGLYHTNYFIGEIDFQTAGCYVNPQDGNWCLGLASDTSQTNADAIAIELSTPLTVNQNYQISFYALRNAGAPLISGGLRLGWSNSNSVFGTPIYTCSPQPSIWTMYTHNYTATQADKFITVTPFTGINSWIQVDNFKISMLTEIPTTNLEIGRIHIYPNPFSNSVQLQFDKDVSDCTINLYNSIGQLVRQINDYSGNLLHLNRDDLKSGVYSLHVTQNGKLAFIEKLIVTDN